MLGIGLKTAGSPVAVHGGDAPRRFTFKPIYLWGAGLIRRSIKVAVAVGELAFTREYALGD